MDEEGGVGLGDFDDVPDLQIAIMERRIAALVAVVESNQEQIRLLCGAVMGLYDDMESGAA